MRHVHEQREPVGTRELLGEALRPVRLNRDAHVLHRHEQRQQLGVGHADVAPAYDDFAAQQLEQPPAERRVNARIDFGAHRRRGRRKVRLVNRARDEVQQLDGFIVAGRAWAFAPTGGDGVDAILQNRAHHAARVRAERMSGRNRGPRSCWQRKSGRRWCGPLWRHGRSTPRSTPRFQLTH